MTYQPSNAAILDEVTRRSFADGLRSIAVDRTVPSPDALASFDTFMKVSPADLPFEKPRGSHSEGTRVNGLGCLRKRWRRAAC